MVVDNCPRAGYGTGLSPGKSNGQQGCTRQASPGSELESEQPQATARPCRTTGQLRSSVDGYDGQLLVDRTPPNRLGRRQQAGAGVGNVNDGYPACNNVSNDVLSCFPEDETVLRQGEYSKFIWNTNYPIYIGAGYVDIHLFNAGSEEELFAWRNVSTFRGSVGYRIDDAWLPTQTTWTEGQTSTHSYYFVIATQGADVNAGARHQATFEVLQTSPPATLASQLAASTSALSASSSSASVAATATPAPGPFPGGIPPAVASSIVYSDGGVGNVPLTLTGDLSTITNLAGLNAAAASVSLAQSSLSSVISSLSAAGSPVPPSLLSSLSALSTSNVGIASTESSVVSSIARTRAPSILQDDKSGTGDPVPKWAIALVAVFGFFAFLAALVAIWFLLRRMRRRRETEYIEAKSSTGRGDDSVVTSATPTREASANGTALEKGDRPLSESFSDCTGITGRISSASGAALAGTAGTASQPVRGGSAASGRLGPDDAARGAPMASAKRSESPAMKGLERSNTNSPHQFYDNLPLSARLSGVAGGAPGAGIVNKASSRSLGTNASTGAGTIAPNDAAIMADAYRNVLRKPEFPHRNDDSSDSGDKSIGVLEEGDTPPIMAGAVKGSNVHTPKASGTTTPMAFADSASEGEEESRKKELTKASKAALVALEKGYGGRESDEEDGMEANELLRHELASEGTSVKSNIERKRPDIRHD